MRKILWIISLLFLVFSSCKKADPPYNGDFEISGKVLDELTGKPIPYATVGVLEISRDDFLGMGAKTVVSGYADENGAFSFKFYANEHSNHYELAARESDMYFEKSSFPYISFNKKGKTTQNVSLMPKGYLTLHIKGNKGGWMWGGGAFGGGLGMQYMGVDTFVTLQEKPNRNTELTYEVRDKDMNIIEKKTEEVFIPLPPDTAFYLIEF